MVPDLPEKVLGIDIDDEDASTQRESTERDEEDRIRVVFLGVGDHRLAVPVDDVRTTTEVPDDLTRVPRAPAAIEGVTDLRGEITAVIDPTVHFPTDADRSGRAQLLVFDRAADEQSAAIRVDEVRSVDAIRESNLLDADAVEDSEFSGDVLAHPLVSELVRRERDRGQEGTRERERERDEVRDTDRLDDAETDTQPESDPTPIADTASDSAASTETAEPAGALADSDSGFGFDSNGGAVIESADEFEDGGAETVDDDSPGSSESAPSTRTVVEATPLIDVDSLLLAAGRAETTSSVLES